jgi:hypothetical protein
MRVDYRIQAVLLVVLVFAFRETRLRAGEAWQPSPGHAQVPENCCPDFAVALYPGHLAIAERNFEPNPDLHITSQTSPTFLLHAEDDRTDPVENSLAYYAALRKVGFSAEMHLFAKGGRAFGLRPTESPITRWPQLVETWLETIGIMSKQRVLLP